MDIENARHPVKGKREILQQAWHASRFEYFRYITESRNHDQVDDDGVFNELI